MDHGLSMLSGPRGHARTDLRSLALGQLVARRLRERPELMRVAEENLSRWQRTCAPNARAALAEWRNVLDAGLETTLRVLTREDERSVRLRQSTPFAGEEIVTRAERNRLLKQFPP